MFDVLEVYERPYNPLRPVVCLDEKSGVQLLKQIRKPLRAKPGKPYREDYEYIRNGTANIFIAVEPKGKYREYRVTKRRSMVAFALFVKYLVDMVYQDAEKIVLVVDNLNIHREQSLRTVFGETEGKRLAGKIEWHLTPKHASWLNQAEIEIHCLCVQCLNRRIPEFKTLALEVRACMEERNRKRCGINWQFTREKAQAKFKLV